MQYRVPLENMVTTAPAKRPDQTRDRTHLCSI